MAPQPGSWSNICICRGCFVFYWFLPRLSSLRFFNEVSVIDLSRVCLGTNESHIKRVTCIMDKDCGFLYIFGIEGSLRDVKGGQALFELVSPKSRICAVIYGAVTQDFIDVPILVWLFRAAGRARCRWTEPTHYICLRAFISYFRNQA